MKKSGFRMVMIVVIGLGCAAMAHAADETDRDGIYELGELVVTGRHREVTAASNIYTITAEDISNMGATTLNDVLELVPGVSIRVGGQGTPRVDIRGFKTRHVVLLLNGVPINDTYDGQFDPTVFPVGKIAGVKVITGGGSVLYGSGGNGGVINIITKKGASGIQGEAGGEYGTENAWLARASVSGGTEKLDVFVSANRESRDAFPLSGDFKPTPEEDGGARENSDMERNALFANMGYAFSGRTRMGLTFNWYQGENGVPPAADRDEEDPFNKNPKYVRVDDTEGFSSQLAFSHVMDNPFSFRGWVYRNQLDVLENRYDDATYATQEKKGAYKNDTETAITGLRGQVSYASAGWLRTTLGLIAENHNWKASGFEMVSVSGGGGGGGGTSSFSSTPFESEEDIDIRSVALEFELAPRDAYGVVLGAGQHFMSGGGVQSDNDTSFIMGGRYDVSGKTRLTASVARKVRFPSLKQLYDVQYGNPDLGTEKTLQYEIGLKQELPSESSLSISAYYSEVKDYIEKLGDNPYANVEVYLFKGVDMSIATRYIENLTLRATYSYLDSEDRSPGTQREELQYRPKHKYVLEGTYTFNSGLMLHGDVTRVADQYFYAENASPMLKRKLNDYTVVNAKISQPLFDRRMALYVRSKNIFDADFEQSYDLPQAGRSVYGGVEIKF